MLFNERHYYLAKMKFDFLLNNVPFGWILDSVALTLVFLFGGIEQHNFMFH